MEKSNLKPFLRNNLDILFVGLNPAKGSSDNRHYFSVNQAFWNQLYDSGLITQSIDKMVADEIIFGNNKFNLNEFNYGITDLITEFAESDSKKINPSVNDVKRLINVIEKYKPKIAVILHGKVLLHLFNYLSKAKPTSNQGFVGEILLNSDTLFYAIAFPHGNAISSDKKIKNYRLIHKRLMSI
jgi:G:T/U-mismatch repair DNA glycosylase